MPYVFLFLAIFSEVIGTTALTASNQFTKLGPSVITVAGYGLAFYFFSFSLRAIPLGVAYAIWGGVGIVLVTLIGFFISSSGSTYRPWRASPSSWPACW